MCGIAGALDLTGRRGFEAARLEAMGAALRHRGPDASGTLSEPGLAMTVQRLALVDPEGGRQPMSAEDGTLHVAVNGELFRHAEERARLERSGERFRTRSDTEVWLHAWRAEGSRYLERAQGQFALAVWSRPDRRLWLARDRFGICPLFIAEAGGWLLWASTARALLASGLVAREADPRGLDHHLVFLGGSPTRSAFRGITPIGAGEVLEVSPDGVRQTRAFATLGLPSQDAARPTDLGSAPDALESLLSRAVEDRLRADAPVAIYLSGGVDSSLVAAIAARGNRRVAAFSVGLRDVGVDETVTATATARHLGLEHVVLGVDEATLVAGFPAAVAAAESPILDHANVCLLLLAREVTARGFKAVLSGEGADEAFAGYPWQRWHAALSRFGGPARRAAQGLLGAIAGGGRLGVIREGHPLARLAIAPLLGVTGRARERFYSEQMRSALAGWVPSDDHRWPLPETGALGQSLVADYQVLLRGHLLADKGDRVAMAAAVEPRFPYLDEELVAFAASLPADLKLRNGTDKWILREVAARYLPGQVAQRRKHMFRAEPVIHGPRRPGWVDQLLTQESLARTGYFEPRRVHAALRARQQRSWNPRRELELTGLTGVVATQLWHHLFLGGGLCDLPVVT